MSRGETLPVLMRTRRSLLIAEGIDWPATVPTNTVRDLEAQTVLSDGECEGDSSGGGPLYPAWSG